MLLAWPCLGPGGRVEASFALSPEGQKRASGSPGAEVRLYLNGDETEQPATSSTARPSDDSTPNVPNDPLQRLTLLKDCVAVPPNSRGEGSSSTGSSSSGSGSGSGM